MRFPKPKSFLCAVAFSFSSFLFASSANAGRVTGFEQGDDHFIPFTVASSGYYSIELRSHIEADANLFLYDENNARIAFSTVAGSDVIEGTLNPGTYTIGIRMSFCLSEPCYANINVRREGRPVRLF